MSPREREAIERAAGFMAGARRHVLKLSSGRVAAHLFRPDQRYPAAGTVLVLHGWDSRAEHMRGVIEAILAQGLRVVALDLPGHGASSGRRLNMALAVEAASLADQWFGPFAAIVGHSFGGAVAVNATAGSIEGIAPVVTPRLALISAPSSMPAIFDDFSRFLKLGPRTQLALADQVQRIAGRPLEEFVGANQIAGLAVEALVVHAPDDREVAFSNARAFEAAGPHVRLERAPGLGHRRILADSAVARLVADFIVAPGVVSSLSRAA